MMFDGVLDKRITPNNHQQITTMERCKMVHAHGHGTRLVNAPKLSICIRVEYIKENNEDHKKTMPFRRSAMHL
jgi:hypothetical protein